MASTHTEIYRRFKGEIAARAWRFAPVYQADVRVATRKKLPLVLLFSVPTIAGIVFSFIVYAKFQLESGEGSNVLPGGIGMAGAMAGRMIEVREQISQFNAQTRWFALLVVAWFGAGLIANDRKAGAHLLYFSRPLTRLDYFLGHYLSVCTFGLYAVLAPTLLICVVAGFSSPEFAFFKNDWDLIVATVAYSLVVVGTLSAITLAISSLVRRKSFALVALVGLLVCTGAIGAILRNLQHDRDFFMVSLWSNFSRVGYAMFEIEQRWYAWPASYSFAILGAWLVAALATIALRLRRVEVVA